MINIKTKCFFELLKEDMFTALVIHSDMEVIGDFKGSNKKG